MKRIHDMPFGARVCAEGIQFFLWAPTAAKVELMIEGEPPRVMAPEAAGRLELLARGAGAGTRYSYRINGDLVVPDPASRFQPDGALAASMAVDPASYDWKDGEWRGRPWREAVVWEAHVGAATPGGTYADLAARLPDLADAGITALELMPLSECPGQRNWGYDGVLPFAPNRSYGAPDDLKGLIDKAHALEIMIILDVVYNHFGPTGNFLSSYAAEFFNESEKTPWGAAINFDGAHSRRVRDYFIHNALYWLTEYHFDGLRFDAVHAFVDHSDVPFLEELGSRIRETFPDRHIHLVLENEKNEAHWLARRKDGSPRLFTAQWNDDAHHCWHRLLTGESEGYYEDFDHPARRLGRALAEGFVYQGEPSQHMGGKRRGERSSELPPLAFVSFLQNHDQIGNRAFGERIGRLAPPERVSLAHAVLLLSPQTPMFFMGEEWDASAPFLYFVDFADDPALSKAVRDGRRREFARFAAFADSDNVARIPDPTAAQTFAKSKIDWNERAAEPHASRLKAARELLRLRRECVVPLLASAFLSATHAISDDGLLSVEWRFEAGRLLLAANFGSRPATVAHAGERVIWRSPSAEVAPGEYTLPSWTALFASGASSDA